jgi:uncharacterized OB-fold protein
VNVLHPSSIRIPKDAGDSPCLIGARCEECGTVVFPKMPVCPSCLVNGAMKDVEIGRTGTLFSHTIARFAPKGFAAPFFQAFIDLPEGPRIFALIGAQCPVQPGVLQDGMQMRLVLEPLADTPESKDLLTYKYVPASSGEENRHA